MKITLYIGTLQGGGAERVVANLANNLASKGYEVVVLNTVENEPVYYIREDIHIDYLINEKCQRKLVYKGLLFFFHDAIAKYKLRKYIKQNKTDCYVVLLEHPTIYMLKNRKYISCPIVVSERNYPGIYSPRMKKELFRLSKFADGYVFQTTKACQWYGKQIKNSHISIIPNAINDDFLHFEPICNLKRDVIVSVGRLDKQKNQKLLIKAFSEILTEFPNYSLEIYGTGPEREKLICLAKELGIDTKVQFKGFSSDIKMQIYNAKLFVLTSDFEGLPNSLIEAMSLGLPCITTDFAGGGAHDIITDGVDGLIVKAGDKEAVVNAIRRVLSDDALSFSLSENAKLLKVRLNPDYIYNEWEKAIIDTLNRWRGNHEIL